MARTARRCASCGSPHGGKGAAVRAGMLAATARPRSSSPTPTWRRRPTSCRCSSRRWPTTTSSLGSRIQPDGSDMRATQPGYRRLLGKVFHVLASIWVVGPVQDTQCGFKGFTPRRGARPVRAPAGHQHRLRRRADLPRPAARLPDRDRARSAGTTSAARGCARSPGLALRVAWDLFRIPLIHRGSGRSAHDRGRDGPRCLAPARRGRRCRSSRSSSFASVVGAVDPGRRPATRSATTSWPTTRPRVRLLDGQPLYDMSFDVDRRVRAVLLPADVRAADPAVRRCCRRRPRSGSGRRCSIGVVRRRGRDPAGLAARCAGGSSCSPGCRGRSSTRSSSARSGRSCSCCSPSAGAGSTTRSALGVSAALGHGDQAPAGDPLRLGGADRPLAGGGRRARSSWRRWPSSRRCSPASAPGPTS